MAQLKIFDGTEFIDVGGPSELLFSDHGGLTGLEDDDHSLYLPRDGTRPMTGDLDLGTNDLTDGGTKASTPAEIFDHRVATANVHGVVTPVGETETQTLASKTLTLPTIAAFTNATHGHEDAVGGGQLDFNDVFRDLVESSPPSTPSTNDIFFHSGHKKFYFYTGAKWLSTDEQVLIYGRQGAQPDNTFLKIGDSTGNANRSFFIPYNMAISALSWSCQTASAEVGAAVSIQRAGSEIHSFDVEGLTTATELDLDINLVIGGLLQCKYVSLGATTISNSVFAVFLRRRTS